MRRRSPAAPAAERTGAGSRPRPKNAGWRDNARASNIAGTTDSAVESAACHTCEARDTQQIGIESGDGSDESRAPSRIRPRNAPPISAGSLPRLATPARIGDLHGARAACSSWRWRAAVRVTLPLVGRAASERNAVEFVRRGGGRMNELSDPHPDPLRGSTLPTRGRVRRSLAHRREPFVHPGLAVLVDLLGRRSASFRASPALSNAGLSGLSVLPAGNIQLVSGMTSWNAGAGHECQELLRPADWLAPVGCHAGHLDLQIVALRESRGLISVRCPRRRCGRPAMSCRTAPSAPRPW